ncbi:MAG: DUF2971 domain-containing protein [Bacilli bacterium]
MKNKKDIVNIGGDKDDFSLYRYRSCSDHNLKAFMFEEIVATTPDQFNDNYDSSFNIDKTLLLNYMKESFADIIGRISYWYNLFDTEDFNDNDIKGDYLYEQAINLFYEKLLLFLKRQYFIICFSRKFDNDVMWSHYASNGKGYVLEYSSEQLNAFHKHYEINKYISVSKDSILTKPKLQKVKYNNNKYDDTDFFKEFVDYINKYYNSRPYEHYASLENISELFISDCLKKDKFILNKMINKTVFIKNKEWKYEQEWRLIIPNIFNIKAEHKAFSCKPKAIYIGEYMDILHKFTLIKFANYHNIKIYKMYSENNILKAEPMNEKEFDYILNI